MERRTFLRLGAIFPAVFLKANELEAQTEKTDEILTYNQGETITLTASSNVNVPVPTIQIIDSFGTVVLPSFPMTYVGKLGKDNYGHFFYHDVIPSLPINTYTAIVSITNFEGIVKHSLPFKIIPGK